ncbi:MAG: M15 family metallopeptidase [Halioglobus sp.]|nr:M15 family metallopeptidase [Halioglobus sp.]
MTGREETHVVELPCGHRLQAAAAAAFAQLQEDARDAGFGLAIASSFRSYSRQLLIWNGKASGLRKVHDDAGRDVDISALAGAEKVRAILRYSAIPGTSRHHWGTDLDVYDLAAVPPGYQLELSPAEVAAGGLFDPLHRWLDERMAAGESRGFYRPYAADRGGVAPERWHLSYAPLATTCEPQLSESLLLACWEDCPAGEEALLLAEEIRAQLPLIMGTYVSVAAGWCPAHYPV